MLPTNTSPAESALTKQNRDRLFAAWLRLDEGTRLCHDYILDGTTHEEVFRLVRTVEAALCELRSLERNLAGVPEPKEG